MMSKETNNIIPLIPQELLPDEERIKFSKLLLCGICDGVLWKPVKCVECDSYFCSECITTFGSINFQKCICGASFSPFKAGKKLLDSLEELKLKCKHVKNGCSEILAYSAWLTHSDNCLYKKIKCTNTGCEKECMKKDMPVHNEICDFGIVKCKYCEHGILRKDIKNHEEKECEFKTEKCPGCKHDIIVKTMENHVLKCGDIEISCPKCEFNGKRSVVEKHDCIFYLKKCLKETNEKMLKLEETISSLFKLCTLCKILKLGYKFPKSGCEKCKIQVCEDCRKLCTNCGKAFCTTCEKELNSCSKCSISLCKSCIQTCGCGKLICKKCICHNYRWADGTNIHTVKPNAVMSTMDVLPRYCKIKLKLHSDIQDCACVGITSKKYNQVSRSYGIGCLSESVECGWCWCKCGSLPGAQNGPQVKSGFSTSGLRIKNGDIVEITLSKAGNFEVTHNGNYKGIANTNLGDTQYYLAIGTSSKNYTVEILSVEEI